MKSKKGSLTDCRFQKNFSFRALIEDQLGHGGSFLKNGGRILLFKPITTLMLLYNRHWIDLSPASVTAVTLVASKESLTSPLTTKQYVQYPLALISHILNIVM